MLRTKKKNLISILSILWDYLMLSVKNSCRSFINNFKNFSMKN